MIIKNYEELFNLEKPIVVFDLETTGLNSNNDRIIEMAAIKVENNKITETYSTLTNPGISVPYYATKVNGITTEMLDGKINDNDAVLKLIEMFKDAIIVAHNISFDIGFINAYLRRMNKKELTNKLVDTVRLSRKAFPGYPKYKLGMIAENLGIDVKNAHRAEDDTRVCYELFVKSINKLKGK